MDNNAKITQKNTELFIWCDGGSRNNPGPGASAFVAKDNKGKLIYKEGKFLGKTTNNLAEYNAVLLALMWLKNNSEFPTPREALSLSKDKVEGLIPNCEFYLDSRLVVSQLNGIFKIKDSGLREILFKIKMLENEIKIPISYNLIPRERNWEADQLVNQILDKNLLY